MEKRRNFLIFFFSFAVVLFSICVLFLAACADRSFLSGGDNMQQGAPDGNDNTQQGASGGDGPTSGNTQEIEVRSVSFGKTSLSMRVGEEIVLVVTIEPNNATDKSIEWSNTNPSVVSADGGRIIALSEGETVITAKTKNGKQATCRINVIGPEASFIVLNQTELELEAGDEVNLTATVYPENAADKSITWATSDAAVAAVSEGKITAEGEGTATITASTKNGKKAVCTVKVIDAHGLVFKECPGGYTVVGYTGGSSSVIVPETWKGKPVVAIGQEQDDLYFPKDAGFYQCENVTSVTLPDTITVIYPLAFAFSGITEIELPSVIQLYNLVFYRCDHLQSLTMWAVDNQYRGLFGPPSKSLKQVILREGSVLGDNAFANFTALEEVVLPEGLKEIGQSAFEGCSALKSINIPDSTETIGDSAFSGCAALTKLTVPESVTSIGKAAFKDCDSLEELTLPFVQKDAPFHQYYFDITASEQIYTYYGTGDSSLEPDEVKTYHVMGHVFGIPVNGTDWYYSKSSITENGITYRYSGEPINVITWDGRYEITVGVSWEVPQSWSAKFYYEEEIVLPLKKLIVTNQEISAEDAVFEKCGFEIIVLKDQAEVVSLEISGENTAALDEFSLNAYELKVGYRDGTTATVPMKEEYLTESDRKLLQTAGTHTVTVSYGGSQTLWTITLTDDKEQSEGLEVQGGYIVGIGSCKDSELVLNMPVAERAFVGCETIEKVTFGEGVTSIGRQAFGDSGVGCDRLTEAVFLSSVPPEIASDVFGSTWNHAAGFIVYVPEGSMEAYCSVEDIYWQQYLVQAGRIREMI